MSVMKGHFDAALALQSQKASLAAVTAAGNAAFNTVRGLLGAIIAASLVAGAIVIYHVRDIAYYLRLVIGQLAAVARQVVSTSEQIASASQAHDH